MKNKIIVCLLLLIGLMACKNNDDTMRFRALNEGMKRYGDAIQAGNDQINRELRQKLRDPMTATKAKIWQPKADSVKALADSLIRYIEVLKNDLRQEAGMTQVDGQKVVDENNRDAVDIVFEKRGCADTLYHKLIEFKEKAVSVLNPDEANYSPILKADIKRIREQFINRLPINKEIPVAAYFKKASVPAALTMLYKLQNDVSVTANDLLECIKDMMCVIIEDFEMFSVIAVQNTNNLKAGESLEITAGVGRFNSDPAAKITIDGKKMVLDDEGVAIYKIKAPAKPGKYIITVKVDYRTADSVARSMTKKIEYTVIE